MTISLSITVGILCATVITVLFESSCLIILCRTTSVAELMEAVASSRTRILFLLRRTLMKDSITEDYASVMITVKASLYEQFQEKKV